VVIDLKSIHDFTVPRTAGFRHTPPPEIFDRPTGRPVSGKPYRPTRCTVRDDLSMQVTLLYDRDCGFCRWCLGKVLAWDRRGSIRPVAIQSEEADRLLTGMPEQERLASWHLVEQNGTVRSAGEAFPRLFRLLPGGSPVAALTARAPRATERGYRWVAGNRSRWGMLVSKGAKRRADERITGRRG
jgi:predicted DCC family thiol-disulfide oxidoreductase YuxK